jgi:hypothetical protein
MKQSPSEADCRLSSQEISPLLRKHKVYYRVHKRQLLVSILEPDESQSTYPHILLP